MPNRPQVMALGDLLILWGVRRCGCGDGAGWWGTRDGPCTDDGKCDAMLDGLRRGLDLE